MEIKTTDLYCASYIFSKGGELKEVILSHRGRRPCCEFVFIGDQVCQLEKTFLSGKATVEITTFKASLNHIKDVMFKELRDVNRSRLAVHGSQPPRPKRSVLS